MKFKVLTAPPIEMKPGALVDYQLTLHYLPIRWRTEITEWLPPYRFVDTQLRGPYKRWHHEHTFKEVDGRTIVEDSVHYIPRGGGLIHRFFVKPNLIQIFEYRQKRMAEIFQSEEFTADKPVCV